MILFIFEGKRFDDYGNIEEEGEFKDGYLDGYGQKRDINNDLLFGVIFSFIE